MNETERDIAWQFYTWGVRDGVESAGRTPDPMRDNISAFEELVKKYEKMKEEAESQGEDTSVEDMLRTLEDDD